jgi:hypothetical protein
MLNKGAETLPAKDAQAFKQLAVIFFVYNRNFTMQKTSKRD